jgi:hypothetical protein
MRGVSDKKHRDDKLLQKNKTAINTKRTARILVMIRMVDILK